jgi:hypothetical protein
MAATASPRTVDRVLREYDEEKWADILWKIDNSYAHEKNLATIIHGLLDSDALRESYKKIADMLVEKAEDVDVIVELGSGWGVNLFNIWLQGGPRGIPYYALDISGFGRMATYRLAAFANGMDCRQRHFNYYEPDSLSCLPLYERALVFTVHSIEQIPKISPDIFKELLNRLRYVRGCHFEPVGWQLEKAVIELGSGWGVMSSDLAAHRYAEAHDYNRNLIPVLERLEREGALSIQSTTPNVSVVNAENPTMLVEWESV